MVDVDPRNPSRLMTCSLILQPKGEYAQGMEGWGVVVYMSDDGGTSWVPTFERYPLMDPTCAFGPDGTAYLLAFDEKIGSTDMRLFRSTDGGRKWDQTAQLRGMDRPYLTIDRTDGTRRGRIYLHGQVASTSTMDGATRPSGLKLYMSADSGRSFPRGTSSPRDLERRRTDAEHGDHGLRSVHARLSLASRRIDRSLDRR